MDYKMLVEMIARMNEVERQTFINEIEKRFPNLTDELGFYIGVAQQERDIQLEMNI